MTRLELRQKFREENPEVTSRVLTDGQLNTWMKQGDLEICAVTRCIVSNESEIILSEADLQYYDLTGIDRFLDIDDIPGGGVYYDDVPLSKASPNEMNTRKRKWKTNASGTPNFWWRRGKYLWLDKPAGDDDLEIAIDCILFPNDFDSDSDIPYDNLEHLTPYHDGVSKYLQWRAKQELKKYEEAKVAESDYTKYIVWMKKMVSGYSHSSIRRRPYYYPRATATFPR